MSVEWQCGISSYRLRYSVIGEIAYHGVMVFPPQDDYTPVSESMHKNDKSIMLHFDTSGSVLVEGGTSEVSVSMSLLTD